MWKKTCLLFLMLVVGILISFSQNSAVIDEIRGTRIVFNFDSFKDIKNGKTLGTAPTGFTELRIYYKHAAINGWNLFVKANTATLDPSYGSINLALSTIELTTYLDGIFQNTVPLSSSDVLISSKTGDYSGGGIHVVTITYDCAKLGELMGLETEVFTTDLIFTLQSQ